jgi:hypothetical protein
LCFFGRWKLSSSFVAKSFVDSNKVMIVMDTKGAQALRAAGQLVVAGLLLRSDAPRAPATQRRQSL